MKITRIITNIYADDPSKASSFYGDIFGLDVLMDHGWINTYGSLEEEGSELDVMIRLD